MYLNRPRSEGDRVYRGVLPSWDNTARRGERGSIILNGTPENYEYWLSEAIRLTRQESPPGERLVFINAWNEWAEGCHLEPCRKNGYAYLEATSRAKAGSVLAGWKDVGLPAGIGLATQSEATSRSVKRKKGPLSRGFKAVRDTLNGRRFKGPS
jgi:Glycosyltransferase WbsX